LGMGRGSLFLLRGPGEGKQTRIRPLRYGVTRRSLIIENAIGGRELELDRSSGNFVAGRSYNFKGMSGDNQLFLIEIN
jgi:hypothetical protein